MSANTMTIKYADGSATGLLAIKNCELTFNGEISIEDLADMGSLSNDFDHEEEEEVKSLDDLFGDYSTEQLEEILLNINNLSQIIDLGGFNIAEMDLTSIEVQISGEDVVFTGTAVSVQYIPFSLQGVFIALERGYRKWYKTVLDTCDREGFQTSFDFGDFALHKDQRRNLLLKSANFDGQVGNLMDDEDDETINQDTAEDYTVSYTNPRV